MRQIVFDTETTGFNNQGSMAEGHRVVEIGCIELDNRRPTGRHFHCYLNPEREVELEAYHVHGLGNDFLSEQPTFADIAADFWQYLQGADELIAHNMPFDQAFLNQELALIGDSRRLESEFHLIDSLVLARQTFYAQRYNLDALCKRFGIDNSKRELHGALLDAELLAEVYLKLTGGQTDLSFTVNNPTTTQQQPSAPNADKQRWLRANVSTQELDAHAQILQAIQSSE